MVLEDLPFIGGPLWILVIGATLLELISMAYDLAVQAEAVSVAVWFFVAGGDCDHHFVAAAVDWSLHLCISIGAVGRAAGDARGRQTSQRDVLNGSHGITPCAERLGRCGAGRRGFFRRVCITARQMRRG